MDVEEDDDDDDDDDDSQSLQVFLQFCCIARPRTGSLQNMADSAHVFALSKQLPVDDGDDDEEDESSIESYGREPRPVDDDDDEESSTESYGREPRLFVDSLRVLMLLLVFLLDFFALASHILHVFWHMRRTLAPSCASKHSALRLAQAVEVSAHSIVVVRLSASSSSFCSLDIARPEPADLPPSTGFASGRFVLHVLQV